MVVTPFLSSVYFRKGNCRRAYVGRPCEVGLRCRTYYVLSGSVLGCWTKVEAVLASLPGGHATRMQIIRLKTDEGLRIVGECVASFVDVLHKSISEEIMLL